MRLFNKTGEGASEIVAAVGLISDDVAFDKWEAVLAFGMRDLGGIIGSDTVAGLAELYESDDCDSLIIRYAQQSVAYFSWLKIIPTLDANHSTNGRSARLGENEKGLTALQEYKDEENIRHLAYEATDALIEMMEREEFAPWLNSRKYRQREGLLIRTKEDFDDYYNIGSHRLFITLLPIMREVQGAELAPLLGRELLADVLNSDTSHPNIKEVAARALALLTMQKAVERLPVEVIPEGVVQVQQSLPANQRLKAEKEARLSVGASLAADGKRYLAQLQSLVAEINSGVIDDYVESPLVHSRGMTF